MTSSTTGLQHGATIHQDQHASMYACMHACMLGVHIKHSSVLQAVAHTLAAEVLLA
jgi:transcriptional antiterminator Rof (Rho-off)